MYMYIHALKTYTLCVLALAVCVHWLMYIIVVHFSGSWKTKTFKAYNFDALGVPPTRGHFHPLMKVRAEIRQIFLEMG